MKLIRQWAFILYPFGVVMLFQVLISKESRAGRIRTLAVSQDRPAVVVLAFEKTTAISFRTKPEKIVPGAPNKVQIEFLGNDITVTPLGPNPGNLHVYTKTGHYVILLTIGTGENYDDVVEVSPGGSGRPLRLDRDTYTVALARFVIKTKKDGHTVEKEIPVAVSGSGSQISGEELSEALAKFQPLRCQGCIVKAGSDKQTVTIGCAKSVKELSCSSGNAVIRIELRGGA